MDIKSVVLFFDKEYKEPGLLEYVKMILDRISGW